MLRKLLSRLAEGGLSTLGDLANEFDVSQRELVAMLDNLVALGYLRDAAAGIQDALAGAASCGDSAGFAGCAGCKGCAAGCGAAIGNGAAAGNGAGAAGGRVAWEVTPKGLAASGR